MAQKPSAARASRARQLPAAHRGVQQRPPVLQLLVFGSHRAHAAHFTLAQRQRAHIAGSTKRTAEHPCIHIHDAERHASCGGTHLRPHLRGHSLVCLALFLGPLCFCFDLIQSDAGRERARKIATSHRCAPLGARARFCCGWPSQLRFCLQLSLWR